MSLRSLLSTTISSTESAVLGAVKAGGIVGDSLDWLSRQASRINSEETIKNEERSHRLAIAEAEANLIKRAEEINIAQVKADIKDLDELLGIK